MSTKNYKQKNLTNLNKRQSLYDNYNRTNSPDSNFFEREATGSRGGDARGMS